MRKCKKCEKEFLPVGKEIYCSKKCKYEVKNEARRKGTTTITSNCIFCGNEFEKKRNNHLFCSSLCEKKMWKINNPECYHGERAKKRFNKWRDNNRDKIRATKQRYKAKRRLKDVNFKLNELIGNAIRLSIQDKGFKKWSSILGYSVETLKIHLESTLPNNITWEIFLNSKNKFHIDHIIPMSAYNFNSYNDIEFKKCWNYRNLRIVKEKENREKSDSIQPELIEKYNIKDLLPEKFCF